MAAGDREEEGTEGRTRIPVRDRRKLHTEAGSADAGGAVVGEPVLPEAPASGGDPANEAAVAEANAKAASYLDDLQRLKAEFDNYRKRTLKEQTRLIEMASADIVAQLLGVMDHFRMALTSAEASKDFDAMLKGVQMVYGELKRVLESAGLEIVEPKGQPFDPNVHEAVFQDEGDGSGHLVVDDVLRNGYLFKGAVLRPAMVKVTQNADPYGAEAEGSSTK
ncbi:MAG TPA: nucleotide exchange factor GrpE [Actinomycetota bacterium]|nr:nucleotide exchange factor GrpE [Actinomycetota bacterium]